MEIAAVHAVLFVEAVINPPVVLAPVERTRLLERGVVGGRRVYIGDGQFLHGAVDSRDCLSIRAKSHRRTVESQIRQIAIWNWLTGRHRGASYGINRRITGRNIERAAAGTEIAQSFRA